MIALHVWAGSAFETRGRCRKCQQPFRLHVRFDTGKKIPLRMDATKLRTEKDDAGRHYDVYAWSDVHRCKN